MRDGPFDLFDADISGERTATIVSPAGEPEPEPSFDEKRAISSVVSDYGGLHLTDLLDHVYFDTEPMINVEQRMEALDFTTVLSNEYYKVRELKIDRKTKNQIREAFREKVRKLRGERTT